MATITGLRISMVLDLPANAYGVTNTPPWVQHDQMVHLADSPGYSANGIRFIREAGIACLEPKPYLIDAATAMWTFPSGAQNWTTCNQGGLNKQMLYQPDGSKDVEFNATSDWELYPNSGFYAIIQRGEAAARLSTDAPLDGSNYYTALEIGAGATVPSNPTDYSAGRPFRLVFQYGRPPYLQAGIVADGAWVYTDTFNAESAVAADTQMRSEQLFDTQNRQLFIEWLPLPEQNMLMVSILGLDKPLIFRGSQSLGYALQVAQGAIHFYGQNGVAGLCYFPMRFTPSGSFTSADIAIPFVYQGNGSLRFYGASQPSGTLISGDISGTDGAGTATNSTTGTTATNYVNYVVSMSAEADDTGLAATTPFIQQVQLLIPPTAYYGQITGGYTDISQYIGSVEEESWFDEQTLTIRRQVGVMLTNKDSLFAGGMDGVHYAVSYARNLIVDGDDLSAPVQYVTGWCGFKTSVWRADPRRQFDLIIEDGLFPLERQQIGQSIVLDGWCCKRAAGFLLEMSGRTDDFIDPELLECDTGPNPEGCPHLKLPLGTAESPKVAPHPEMTYMEAMYDLQKYLFAVFFADEFNVARLVDYYPNVFDAPFLGTFTTNGYGDGDPAGDGFLSQIIEGGRLDISTDDRRTAVFFAGLDPATNMLQGTYLRIDDIPGYEGYAELFHGFNEPLIEISDRFVDPVFTAAYAQNALARIWLPTVGFEHTAQFCPGMSPLLQYAVEDDADGGAMLDSGPLWLSVERVHSRMIVGQPHSMRSQITGRSVYNS